MTVICVCVKSWKRWIAPCTRVVGSLSRQGKALMKSHMLMTTRRRRPYPMTFVCLLFLPTLLFLAACSLRPAISETPAGRGIAVAPEFDDFYRDYGGAPIFGYPISAAYRDHESGHLVQYFLRMRLEYDATQSADQRVIVAPLGEWAYAGLTSLATVPAPESSRQRHFSGTEHVVQNGFLAFYETHYGEKLFGPPISPLLDEGGRRIQYFRNARLEWRPEAPLEHRVQVGWLGEAHFYNSGAAVRYGAIIRGQNVASNDVEQVIVSASARAPILYYGDEQIIYAEVTTPEGIAVSGVTVHLSIAYDAKLDEIVLGETNEAGKAQGRLTLVDATPAQQIRVTVSVLAADGRAIGSNLVTFKSWW